MSHVYDFVCLYIYIYTHMVCMCIYVYIYIEPHTHTQVAPQKMRITGLDAPGITAVGSPAVVYRILPKIRYPKFWNGADHDVFQ